MSLDNEISPQPSQMRKTFIRAVRYLLRRILAITLTIFVGVFVTVLIANSSGMLDQIAGARIDREILYLTIFQEDHGDLEAARAELVAKSDLALPYLPRQLKYTLRSLTLDWGNVMDHRKFNMYVMTGTGLVGTDDSRLIIFAKLPNTLLLSGVAYLLLFLLGIPIALFLSQHEGHWLDRFAGVLTPLSSVPSWVIGVILVLIFAAQLRWFPAGRMIDAIPPATTWESIKVIAFHLVLPVTAIVISLIFQLVNNWRTYLLIYSQEDYVDLAKAIGLKKRAIAMQYILRPVLPYMLTSFVLTLVGFWQTITALEYFFQWPGIGKMFVDALPNFRGESMYSGEMTLILGIVVLFAYLLGIAAFLLDFLYVIVDPRLQVETESPLAMARLVREPGKLALALQRLFRRRKVAPPNLPASSGMNPIPMQGTNAAGMKTTLDQLLADRSPAAKAVQLIRMPAAVAARMKVALDQLLIDQSPHPRGMSPIPAPVARGTALKYALRAFASSVRRAMHEIGKVPAAVAGVVMVTLLVLTAVAVMIFMPFASTAERWTDSTLVTNPTTAKLALPEWINWFRKSPLPSTIVLDPKSGTAAKQVLSTTDGVTQIQFNFTFDYPYQDIPSDMALYLTPHYTSKIPFMSLTWITPDGRQIQLKNAAVAAEMTYGFDTNVPYLQQVAANVHWKSWFVTSGNYRTPGFNLLFAGPLADTAAALPGKYTLRVNASVFEPDSSLDAQLVVFGKVEGWAGTDYLRRDLLVPLLWGLPIALLFGVGGAVATAILSLIIAAASAWYGGWLDGLVQRATEANLILPVMAIGVLLYAYYNLNLWLILALIIFLNILGSPTKAFRAAFLQEKQSAYVEAAQVYGASDWRIISRYLVPRIFPVVIPQIVILIPNFFFLEATLAIFNISDPRYPTWGRIIYDGLRYGALYGSQFWVLEPIAMMLVTGLAFVLVGFALNRILNPQLSK